MAREITTLQEMLDRIGDSADEVGRVSLGKIVESVGNRSFGPLLLMVGVIAASPLSGMPGVPTATGVLILLIAGQLFFRRDHFWLPKWLLRRSLAQEKVHKAVRWLRPVARFIDRVMRPRLPALIRGGSIYLISFACAAIAVVMPVMELVPFSAHGAGLALTAFGLALISRDGLLALIAFAVTAVSFALVIYQFS
ncbi:exopolysaccharide biosynthesis protein [Geomonas nitrogeniifigens]|uniref:Exopolysaccharide biosynthesis protein n=1 Tax=Geomonas diazotrophica TaxID=2843197 RepID=A0ABX8JKR1_9BACT|nr:exopolysaccharide biosynthesis protein [Geomonas nitrogeniifigens]QWV98338.1 exopolysaccharide biosynthesis protein [Geomonas nitrogeniifigens]QXE87521.1 exopolysaccharide biosynthesis protein [Geomonas nitrogeniifigens]